jgi:hypothetical protein
VDADRKLSLMVFPHFRETVRLPREAPIHLSQSAIFAFDKPCGEIGHIGISGEGVPDSANKAAARQRLAVLVKLAVLLLILSEVHAIAEDLFC